MWNVSLCLVGLVLEVGTCCLIFNCRQAVFVLHRWLSVGGPGLFRQFSNFLSLAASVSAFFLSFLYISTLLALN